MDDNGTEKLCLLIPDELAEHMDRALITPDDARQTFAYCQASGVKLRDDDTGDLLGHRRIGALTFWVRYRRVNGTYQLRGIYSHRAALEDTPAVPGKPLMHSPSCVKCSTRLTEQKVTFHYLDFPISAPLPRCPVCGQVYLSEEFVEGKLAEVEKTLEDK